MDSRARPESFLQAEKVDDWEKPLLSYYERGGDRYGCGSGWGTPAKKRSQKTWFSSPEMKSASS